MDKINFVNGQAPALNAINLNQMQTNVENAINTKIDKHLGSYSGNLNDLKETGIVYAIPSAVNMPKSGYACYLTTIAYTEKYILQKANLVLDHERYFEEYERQCYNGTWTAWRKVSPNNITTGAEFKTGRIIDGKEEYGKRIDCGALPDGTGLRTIAHGISNFMVTKIEAYAYSSTYGRWMTLPLVENGAGSAYNVSINVDTTKITLNSDNSQAHYNAYVTIYYTKI